MWRPSGKAVVVARLGRRLALERSLPLAQQLDNAVLLFTAKKKFVPCPPATRSDGPRRTPALTAADLRFRSSGTRCVARKTKCDKVIPCSACVKRGDPTSCVVEGVDESSACVLASSP